MTANEYRATIARLKLSQRKAAGVLGVGERSSRRWALGEAPVPEPVAKLLRLMIKHKLKPEDVK